MIEHDISHNIKLRPSVPEDENFLAAVYGSTRQQELAMVPWTDEQKDAFIRFQLTAQLTHYRTEYPNAEYLIVLHNAEPVGRLYLDLRESEIRIMDITLLPEHRGKGISSPIIHRLKEKALALGKNLSINLDKLSQSQLVFERFGFKPTEDAGFHVLYVWQAESPESKNEESGK